MPPFFRSAPCLPFLPLKAIFGHWSTSVGLGRRRSVGQPLYDLFDYARPTDDRWIPTETTWTTLTGQGCTGGLNATALDYHHVSSVSVGLDGNLLVRRERETWPWP